MSGDPFVSDNAVLRYLEKRLAIDVEAVRGELQAVCRRGAAHGADTVVHQGLRFVLRYDRGAAIVTTTLQRRRDYVHQRGS